MTSEELKERIVATLRAAGVDGMEYEDLVDTIEDEWMDDESSIGSLSDYDLDLALDTMRTDGTIEDVGCSWARLSLKWWGQEIAKQISLDGAAGRIEELLRGARPTVEEV